VVKAPGISGGGSLEEALGSAVIRLHSRRCGQETAAETRDDTHGSLYMSGWAVNSSSSETREMTVDAGKADLQEP
jgi:isocitrate lyase